MKWLIGICELVTLLMLLSGCNNAQTVPITERSVALSEKESVQESTANDESIAKQTGISIKADTKSESASDTKAARGVTDEAEYDMESDIASALEAKSDASTEAKEDTSDTVSTEENAEILETDSNGIVKLEFKDMYSGSSSSRGLVFSDRFSSMDGKTMQISGYMAPPLKPVFNFFVLSKEPMSICPFCSTDADWPEDIMVVYVEEGAKSVANDTLLTVTGRLELGSYTDEETGFVSQARIYAEKIEHNR